jgi:hypothetical protein
MTRWVITLFAAAALVIAPAALSRSGSARTVALAPNTARTLTVGCPRGSAALSGGVQSPWNGTSTLAVSPSGSAAFRIRVGNPAGNSKQRVTAVTNCRALAQGGQFELSHVSKRVSIPAHGQKQVSLACPNGTLTAGAGFDLVLGSKAAKTPLDLRRQTQTLRGFSFTLQNVGGSARSAELFGTCARVVGGRLQMSVTTMTTPVHPGGQVVQDRCRTGWFSVATGYVLPSSVKVGGSAAVTGGGRWTLQNRDANQALVQLQLVCGRVSELDIRS